MVKKSVSISDVFSASRRIYPIVKVTPLIESLALKEQFKANSICFKAEMMQETGSFKIRGAANRILSLTDEQKKRGVITFSTGNHGRAVAYVSHSNGIPATICVSKRVPQYRVASIEALGGKVVQKGNSQDDAEKEYERLKEEHHLIPVVPFDDPYIAAGQGTISLEIYNQMPQIDTLIVPLSGGGLLGGMAMAIKSIKPSVKVIGVSIARSPAMLESVKAKKVVQVEEQDTIADSLLGGIGFDNQYTLDLVTRYVDEHVVVDEEEIIEAMRYLFFNHGIVVEGASATSLAAIQTGLVNVEGRHVAMPLTGRNVDFEKYLSLIHSK